MLGMQWGCEGRSFQKVSWSSGYVNVYFCGCLQGSVYVSISVYLGEEWICKYSKKLGIDVGSGYVRVGDFRG